MGIREVIFVFITSIICLVALVRPRIGLYGYVWYALMRPDIMAFAEAKYPFSLLLAVTTGLGTIPYIQQTLTLFKNPFSRMLLLLQLPIATSVLFAVVPELTYERYGIYIKMILVLLFIPVLITTESDLRTLLLVIVLSLGFVGAKFGVYGVIHGGVELAAGYGDMLADNNFVALALAMLLPLCWHCRALVSSRVMKWILLGLIGACIAGIVMSSSRGGSLSMALGLLLIFRRSKYKIGTIAVMGLFAAGAIYLVHDMYVKRMETLRVPEQEASAESRIVHAKTALAMWRDHPILGVGFGGFNYAYLASRYMGEENTHVAHNSYLQMLVDSGIFAFLLYVGLLLYAIIWLSKSAARMRDRGTAIESIPLAIRDSLIVFAFGSTFYSCQRMDIPYMFLMCAASWYMIERGLPAVEQKDLTTELMDTGISAIAK